ncbi:hypothetical protein [Micromonospora luteifusca]|uniref:hypothetical protein n=1 Tax=Micromonospora luteifusca TaxID=709860 RepID=UPI0033B924C3
MATGSARVRAELDLGEDVSDLLGLAAAVADRTRSHCGRGESYVQVFQVSLILLITAPEDASRPAFIDDLRDQLVQLQHRGEGVIAPTVRGMIETHTCEVTLSVMADDITTAPIAAGRVVAYAADRAAPSYRVAIGRITV